MIKILRKIDYLFKDIRISYILLKKYPEFKKVTSEFLEIFKTI